MTLIRFLVLLFLLPAFAFADAPPPPTVAAKAWLLYDYTSAHIIASSNEHERIEPASLTKLMTAYLAFSALKQKTLTLDQVVPVSERAWKTPGSRMFIEPGKPVTVEQLLHGMITQSGNDAAMALAEAVAGSEEVFVQMMNREAQRLGMKDTHFVDPTGLPDPKHYTTAYDLNLLVAALIRDFPEYYPLFSQREFRYDNISQPNRNRLLWLDPHVDGLKTGHTESAGYCLIASAKRGAQRLVSVVLGTDSDSARTQESLKLLNYGFQFYQSAKLYSKGQAVSTLEVWKGAENSVKAGFLSDFYVSAPRGQADQLKADLVSTQPLVAPISVGQKVGMVKVTLQGKLLGEYPVVALENVPVAGFFGRAWDGMRLWFK
ncbi:MAG TPA: D-alanyl-D-alanine carboxypeptidase family protein [Burkholderiales bacterium]|nr:D-alanyl-D-alanine carboxypeptidase family protein [Burkholderiales bacterium]